ncbi:MAG: hypothetical protein IPK12_23330 [Gemmatimonadetes bacterium]|nr:hypothetical protein [Gemmatimonadota bacterium]
MARNRIEDVREHLFAELEDLRNPEKKYDKERTRAVVEVAQTIINSAKAETDFINAIGRGKGSGFIPEAPRVPPTSAPAALPSGTRGEAPAPDDGWMK